MSQQGYDWRGYWEEHGAQAGDGKTVPIRVGVIEVGGTLSVAISVASFPPIVITDRTAAGLGELMQWAQEEHEMLEPQHPQGRLEGPKEARAKRRATAPRDDAAGERQVAEDVSFDQAMAWLDDIDAQLSDIATEIRVLREHFPPPTDGSDTG
ncbi:MAG: hypothetical protein GEV04_18900 [Actinophytocola sp.]|nr:hypothetical protein [Actinophytocola sp.]